MRLSYKNKFDAAHRLYDESWSDEENKRRFGKCCNLHGHTWLVEFELDGEVDPQDGMVVNFVWLKDLINFFDHSYINEKVKFLPTAENLAEWFVKQLIDLERFNYIKVKVWESDHAYAEKEWRTA